MTDYPRHCERSEAIFNKVAVSILQMEEYRSRIVQEDVTQET